MNNTGPKAPAAATAPSSHRTASCNEKASAGRGNKAAESIKISVVERVARGKPSTAEAEEEAGMWC